MSERGSESTAHDDHGRGVEMAADKEAATPPSEAVEDEAVGEKTEAAAASSAPAAATPPPPPDGGLNAWLHVLAAFFMFINTWGITQTFGVFEAYYVEHLLASSGSSAISWIGSLQAFLVTFLGILTGPLFDLGYLRIMIVTGCALIVFGMMMLSLCTEYWQVFLAQGLVVGFGAGLVYIPSLALVATQFSKKRPWAIGCASSGSSVGGIIFPIMFRRLQPQIGFGWAVRCIGFVNLVLSLSALAILLQHKGHRASKLRRLVDLTAFREPPFALFAVALLFIFLAFYVPLFYVPVYASLALGQTQDFAFDLLSITNAGSFVGRTLPMLIATYVGSIQVFVAACVCAAVLIYSWIAIHSVSGFIAFAFLYGITSGVLVVAPSAAISHPVLSPSMSVIGTRMGMSWIFAATGILIGTPIAGALVDVRTANFLPAQLFGGSVVVVGTAFLMSPLKAAINHRRKNPTALA